jgi:hypothetical protein
MSREQAGTDTTRLEMVALADIAIPSSSILVRVPHWIASEACFCRGL